MKVKHLSDYYDTLQELYPQINKKDIATIVRFGWKSMYSILKSGGFVLISDNTFWSYFGFLTNNSLKWAELYSEKLAFKIRTMYRKKHIQWDGYYYFALTQSEYDKYIGQQKSKGRKRVHFKFDKLIFFKIFEECKCTMLGCTYFFRIPYTADVGFRMYKENISLDSPELILKVDSNNLKDILVSNNDYKYI